MGRLRAALFSALPQNLWVHGKMLGAPLQTPGFSEAWLRCSMGAERDPAIQEEGRGRRHQHVISLVILCRAASPQSPTPFRQAV